MKRHQLHITLVLCLFTTAPATAAVLYVDVNSTNATAPYTTWATAATSIQEAVDAAVAGDQILVTSGVYQAGGREVGGTTNRVVVDKPVVVQSVNGPEVTWIHGAGALRCVRLGNGSLLTGFTLTNGFAGPYKAGGGVAFADLNSSAVVSNCVIVGCFAGYTGGGVGIDLAVGGSGPFGGTLNNCIVRSNSAGPLPFYPGVGGGAFGTTLNNCILEGNSAVGGPGGGASSSRLRNCTLTGNSASQGPGGASSCNLRNCIAYYNSAPNHSGSSVAYSCTTPAPAFATGNITNEPLFLNAAAGDFHLQASSPCINSGNNSDVIGPVDVEGKERVVDGRVDMGAYEWVAVPTHYVSLTSPNPTPPYLSWSTAATNMQDAVDRSGNDHRVLVTNGVYQTGGQVAGFPDFVDVMTNRLVVTRPMRVESVNGPDVTTIVGYQVPGTTNGDAAVRCVFLWDGAVISGFTLTNGATRTTSLEGARSGGGVWCKSIAAAVSNCVITGNSAAYQGGGSFRGTLVDCTLRGNSSTEGGGAFSGRLNRCALTLNRARWGGGAAGDYTDVCTLYNCTLTGNLAEEVGGGASGYFFDDDCLLYNCTVTGNQAIEGGGSYRCLLYNCIVYHNMAPGDTYNYSESKLQESCTTPLPWFGHNITNAPAFVDYASGNLRLQSNSPCINAGVNTFLFSFYIPPRRHDLDGNPRIAGVKVDMGAYEFQGAGLDEFSAWLWQYGLRTDGSANHSDTDGDLMNNQAEWIAGTVPTNALSALRLLSPTNDASGVTVSWLSVSNRTYFLERASDLGATPRFSLLTSNIFGQPFTTSFTDSNVIGTGPFFYRVGIQE